jgi:hypothetical protein
MRIGRESLASGAVSVGSGVLVGVRTGVLGGVRTGLSWWWATRPDMGWLEGVLVAAIRVRDVYSGARCGEAGCDAEGIRAAEERLLDEAAREIGERK